jgi:hypothetical protein
MAEGDVVDNGAPADDGTPTGLTDEQRTLIATRWRDAIDPELAGDASLADLKDLGSVVKSFKNAQSLVGRRMEEFYPNDQWDDEKKTEFFKKLGYTDNKAEYEYQHPETAPEDMPSLQDDFQRFVDTVIKNKIPKQQAMSLWKDLSASAAERYQTNKEKFKSTLEAGYESLKKEFGQTYEEKRKAVPATLKKAFGDDFVKFLDETGVGAHPQMVRAGMIITDLFKEDKANTSSERINYGSLRPAEAESLASKMLGDKNNPLNIKSHPEHDEAVDKYYKLMTIASGGRV